MRQRILRRSPRDGNATIPQGLEIKYGTAEFLTTPGLADDAIALGIRTGDAHVWVEGCKRAGFSLARMGAGKSPYSLQAMRGTFIAR
jgi:hypothetical protein